MILVAGGTGTLGSRLVPRLQAAGMAVRVLARNAPGRRPPEPGVNQVVEGDVRDRASIRAAVEGVGTVVSLVHGFAGGRDTSPASVDRDGNVNLIDAAAEVGASFVLMSIVGAGADSPLDLFRMKHAAEEHLRAAGMPWTIVRATAYLETWVRLLEQTAGGSGRPLVFGRGNNPISFVSVEDVAALLAHALTDPSADGAVMEIGGPQDLTFDQLAEAVQRAAGRAGGARHVPRPMLRAMAAGMRHIRPDLARQARAALLMDTTNMSLDSAPVRARYADLPATTVEDVLRARAGADA